MTITIGSMFTGYGGLDLATAAVFGGETVWTADVDPESCKVIRQRFPGAPNLGDVSRVAWTNVQRPTILTGGFPCQDVSIAGPRYGMTSSTRSGLWSAMTDAIDYLRPKLVVIENVRGLLSAAAETDADSDMEPRHGSVAGQEPRLRALGRVLGDLADLGYDAQWCSLRASDVGAPHTRPRIFILAADAYSKRLETSGRPIGGATQLAGADVPVSALPWGRYEPAIRRWESVTGRAAPAPTERTGRRGKLRHSPRFVEWMMGLPEGWVTDIARVHDQASIFDDFETDRLEWKAQIKLLGNGVVPQQAAEALRRLDLIASTY